MIDPIRHRSRLTMPPGLLDSKVVPKPIRDKGAELQRLLGQYQTTLRAIALDENALHQLEDVERQAGADAIRAGKPMPASKLPEIREKLDRQQRELDALAQAVKDSYSAFIAALREHRDTAVQQLLTLDEKDREQETAALTAFEEAYGRRAQHATLRVWLAGFPERPKISTPAGFGRLHSLPTPGGEGAYSVQSAIAALREHANDNGGRPKLENRFAPGADQRDFPPPAAHRTPMGTPGVDLGDAVVTQTTGTGRAA